MRRSLLVAAAASLAATAAHADPKASIDAPEISRFVGVAGGVVVFWPRVVPRDSSGELDAVAEGLRREMEGLVRQTLPEMAAGVDVRPKPERVCPRAGCLAMTAGVLLAHNGAGACVAVALVAPPGKSPTTLVPWVGEVRLKAKTVPFREPPESSISIQDFVRCDFVLGSLRRGAQEVKTALLAAARAAAPAKKPRPPKR